MVAAVLLLVSSLAGLAVVAVDSARSVDAALPELPDLDDVAALDRSTPSVVLAADGTEIARFRADELHVPLRPDAIPRHVEMAVLAAEDSGFYNHSGFDAGAIGRAALANLRSEGIVQGGSTITQQLVKNLYTDGEQTIQRKVDELIAAVRIEQRDSKREILAAYLNTIFLGEGAFGIEAAARSYFRKPAADLTVSEAALLAGIIPAPSRWNPRENPEAAEAKRREVLAQMGQLGMVTEERLGQEIARRPEVFPPRPAISDHPYFVDYVRRWLLDVRGYEPDLVYRGGLRIETTLDRRLHMAARDVIRRHLPDAAHPAGAAVVVEPATGAVLALVGGRDWEQSEVNFALGPLGGGTGRQPGSSFKPFVLATLYEQGASPADRVPAPEEYFPAGADEPVHNYSGRGYGDVTVDEATRRSINTAYVGLTELVGADAVARTATRLGISTLPDPATVGASIGIGAYEVSPLDMASAYGVFANGGLEVEPAPVARVVARDGEVLEDRRSAEDRQRVIDQSTARLVTSTLRGVIADGTGTRAAIGRPAAGKTGTTDSYGNAWFVGYTPKLSTAVWVGHPAGNVPMRDVAGVARVTGGSIPAAIWRDVMGAALADRPVADFPPPPDRPPTQGETTGPPGYSTAPSDDAVTGAGSGPATTHTTTTGAPGATQPTAPRDLSAPPPSTTSPDTAPTTTTAQPATTTTTAQPPTTTTTAQPPTTTTTAQPPTTTTAQPPRSTTTAQPTSATPAP